MKFSISIITATLASLAAGRLQNDSEVGSNACKVPEGHYIHVCVRTSITNLDHLGIHGEAPCLFQADCFAGRLPLPTDYIHNEAMLPKNILFSNINNVHGKLIDKSKRLEFTTEVCYERADHENVAFYPEESINDLILATAFITVLMGAILLIQYVSPDHQYTILLNEMLENIFNRRANALPRQIIRREIPNQDRLMQFLVKPIQPLINRNNKPIIQRELDKLIQLDPTMSNHVFSKNLQCSITNDLMIEPEMVIESRKTYEKSAIEQWFKISTLDPCTHQRLSSLETVPNDTVKSIILEELEKLYTATEARLKAESAETVSASTSARPSHTI